VSGQILLDIDFDAKKALVRTRAKGGVPEAIATCATDALMPFAFDGLDRKFAEYRVAYKLTLTPVADSQQAGPSAATPRERGDKNTAQDATARIEWEIALVRDAARTGSVTARLPRGSQVRIVRTDGGWYNVNYGENFREQGWLYRSALGR